MGLLSSTLVIVVLVFFGLDARTCATLSTILYVVAAIHHEHLVQKFFAIQGQVFEGLTHKKRILTGEISVLFGV